MRPLGIPARQGPFKMNGRCCQAELPRGSLPKPKRLSVTHQPFFDSQGVIYVYKSQSDFELRLHIAFSAGHCHHGVACIILYWILLDDLNFNLMCHQMFKNQSMS